MSAGLEEMALRCEAATGPDRGLDASIHNAVTGFPARLGGVGWPSDSLIVPLFPGWGFLPAYTASLDAAMSLVPEGLRLMLSEWDDEKHLRAKGPWQAVLSKPGCDASFDAMRGHRCNHAATPALALCAAALRAQANTNG